jgi:hypothetical protein
MLCFKERRFHNAFSQWKTRVYKIYILVNVSVQYNTVVYVTLVTTLVTDLLLHPVSSSFTINTTNIPTVSSNKKLSL